MKLILFAVLAGCAFAQPPGRPDVVVLMADDMGYSDIGCYGSEIPTPRLDALAAKGVRLTRFYNTGRCCPTRASLLTGQHQHAVGMGWMNAADERRPGYRGQLSPASVTLGEVAASAGYRTGMVGKWHLSATATLDDGPNESWPTRRGFQRFYGTLEGAKNYWKPKWLYTQETLTEAVPKGYFYTNAITDHAVSFIKETRKEQPLLLYVAYFAPHSPLHAPAEAVTAHRGRYDEGWDSVRQRRFEKQRRIGLVGDDARPAPRDRNVPGWDTLGARDRRRAARKMEIYAAQVSLIDRSVGRIVDALASAGRLESTLLLFLSDNGSNASGGHLGRGAAPAPGASTFADYGRGWAHVSNTPYPGYKSSAEQGGVVTPLVAHWPRGLPIGGVLRDGVAHVIDVMPTVVEVIGADYPEARVGNRVPRPAGMSLVPLLREGRAAPRTLYFEHEGRRAVHQGTWKAVSGGNKKPWRLYDLTTDPFQQRDVAAQRPKVLSGLTATWTEWARENHVLPLDGTGWNKRIKKYKKRDGD